MRIIILLVFSLIASNTFGQKCDPKVTLAGITTGLVKVEDILKDSILKVENNAGKVISFTFTLNVQGDLISLVSRSDRLTNNFIYYLYTAPPASRFYIEDIKVKCNNDSIVDVKYISLKTDGPNADVFRSNQAEEERYSRLLKHPAIYVYPDFGSKDTNQIVVTSFKIRAIKDDYYYEFVSKSNQLTPAMLDFIKKTNSSFTVFDIRALDPSKQRFVLNDIVIEKK